MFNAQNRIRQLMAERGWAIYRLSSGNLPAGAYFIFLGDLCVSAKQEA